MREGEREGGRERGGGRERKREGGRDNEGTARCWCLTDGGVD